MEEKILIVDDDTNILLSFKRQLRRKYDVITAESGTKGIIALKRQGPFAIVVSDFRMPEMDGIEFLSQAREIAPDTVRFMLTGEADMEASVKAINEGNIFRFIKKPCPINEFIKILEAGTKQYRLITAEKELLEKTLSGSIRLLINILSIVSPLTFNRVFRLRQMAKGIAVRLNIDKIWEIEISAMLSQIGCVAIPSDLLLKKYKGNPLTKDEQMIFLEHPKTGEKFLSTIPRLEETAKAIAYQFKQFDGGGFPNDKLEGKSIPLIGRILKVVLDYETIISKGKTPEEAILVMQSKLQWYDPDILAALESEVRSLKEGYIIKLVNLNEILVGMILVDDIKDIAGKVLISKGSEITDVLKKRLLNFTHFSKVVEPIKVLKELTEDSEYT